MPSRSANQSAKKPAKKPRQQSSRKSTSKLKSDRSSDDPNKPIRLQRLLASAGFGSRRRCEELIVEGRVEVNGKIVEELGTSVDAKTAKIFVDGSPLRPQKLVYYAVNKPTGVVTTNSDPEGRPRVIDLVPPSERVFAVGRLDRSSEGLILLTNDGELAQKLAHPKYQIRKVYRATVAGKVTSEAMRSMQKGMYISEGYVKVEGAKVLKARPRATELEITLREGKNREIRRILARLGHKVQQLRRIAIGPLRLGDMPIGSYRVLTHLEIKKLQESAEQSRRAAEANPEKPFRSKSPKKKVSARARAAGRSASGFAETRNTKSRKKPAAKPRSKPSTGLAAGSGISSGGVVIGGESSERKPRKTVKTSSKKRVTRKSSTRASATAKRATKRRPGR
ncbi:Ribosomal large subunit pseudouridine synthase B [Novipirellula aureliae]|uniref:Pseudouridine synthase n=1 Tax=Novipirellula aureliae TaxID=2527966 RepID=A0A5C6DYA5_9BACT|nr:pseudouridine synthase [Novipirellula aureliae]TWU41572.1 Ribosomal large subunit pseudouridine synthase B [Novipirellula aureliae]